MTLTEAESRLGKWKWRSGLKFGQEQMPAAEILARNSGVKGLISMIAPNKGPLYSLYITGDSGVTWAG